MSKFLVRTNCEYSIEVEAEDEEAAVLAAGKIPVETWPHQAWAVGEAEAYGPLDPECSVCRRRHPQDDRHPCE